MGNNYSTTIRCCTSQRDRSQFVFASSSNGTFYAIYGKFMVGPVYGEDGKPLDDKVKLEKIEFELINYTGLIRMSLVKVSIEDYDDTGNNPTIRLRIIVKGEVLSKPNLSIDLTDFSKIPKGEISNETEFNVERTLLSLSGHTWEEIDQGQLDVSEVGGIFDYEFFEGNGRLKPILRKNYDKLFKQDHDSKVLASLHLGVWCIGTKSILITN